MKKSTRYFLLAIPMALSVSCGQRQSSSEQGTIDRADLSSAPQDHVQIDKSDVGVKRQYLVKKADLIIVGTYQAAIYFGQFKLADVDDNLMSNNKPKFLFTEPNSHKSVEYIRVLELLMGNIDGPAYIVESQIDLEADKPMLYFLQKEASIWRVIGCLNTCERDQIKEEIANKK
jgi:hypothetical protein